VTAQLPETTSVPIILVIVASAFLFNQDALATDPPSAAHQEIPLINLSLVTGGVRPVIPHTLAEVFPLHQRQLLATANVGSFTASSVAATVKLNLSVHAVPATAESFPA